METPISPSLCSGKRPLVLVTHEESCFYMMEEISFG